MNIVLAILILEFSIIIHELGHLTFAKRYKVPVQTFSVGFGPKLISRRVGETEYALSLFPMGGYIRMDMTEGFKSRPLGVRAKIIGAGCAFNMIVASIALFFSRLLSQPDGITIAVMLKCLLDSISTMWIITFSSFKLMLGILSPDMIAGPVQTTAVISGSIADVGVLLMLCAVNATLGIINLLPIPALDGGRLVLIGTSKVWKSISGRELNDKIENKIETIGAVLICLIIVLSVVKDIFYIVN